MDDVYENIHFIYLNVKKDFEGWKLEILETENIFDLDSYLCLCTSNDFFNTFIF